MSDTIYYVLTALLTLGVLIGIAMMSKVERAKTGNALSAVCMAAAIVLTLIKYETLSVVELWAAMLVGLALGAWGTVKVKMIQMPQAVALLNGLGGAASAVVGVMELLHPSVVSRFSSATAALAVAVGMLTLTGSLIAAFKLQGMMTQRPVVWRGHALLTAGSIVLTLAAVVCLTFDISIPLMTALCLLLAGFFGVAFAIRVGGADMPITISLLNSFSGVAAGIAGLAIADPLLVAIGGVVGASGLLLTQIMCRAMNRHLIDILLGKTSAPAKPQPAKPAEVPAEKSPALEVKKTDALDALKAAKKVIIVPGYGMALAQAQELVRRLQDVLESAGAEVKYAIHPVAGRMPGHMNVLLAEVDVPYEQLYEMDDINPEFETCDVCIVVGANDVVNPAANTAEGTPIYGMPVLNVEKAKHVILCNYDTKPGYAGVDNPLYTQAQGVTLMLGDAKETLETMLKNLKATGKSEAVPAEIQRTPEEGKADPVQALKAARRVIIVPGYGMALAQAQRLVKRLQDTLEASGAEVKYAIHPVAGRMPGHMNVLLAEVDVPYEQLFEMDDINPEFETCDVCVVIGANDVVNPAANTAEGTPIYGMPVLNVEKAKHVILCNYDTKPGYAGVDNPLYTRPQGVTVLLGDAKETLETMLENF